MADEERDKVWLLAEKLFLAGAEAGPAFDRAFDFVAAGRKMFAKR